MERSIRSTRVPFWPGSVWIRVRKMCASMTSNCDGAIDPLDLDGWRKKGNLERKRGRYEDAIASLRTVFDIDQRDPRVLVGVGKSELALERWGDAAGTFREAIRHGADKGAAHVGLARALVELGSIDAAEKALRGAPELGEEGTDLLRRLTEMRAEKRDGA